MPQGYAPSCDSSAANRISASEARCSNPETSITGSVQATHTKNTGMMASAGVSLSTVGKLLPGAHLAGVPARLAPCFRRATARTARVPRTSLLAVGRCAVPQGAQLRAAGQRAVRGGGTAHTRVTPVGGGGAQDAVLMSATAASDGTEQPTRVPREEVKQVRCSSPPGNHLGFGKPPLESRPKAAARSDLEASAGWASPSSRGMC